MPSFRSTIAACAVIVLSTGAAQAQVVPLPRSRDVPAVWISGSGALVSLQSFAGGEDGAYWSFGDGVQLRGTLERSLRHDVAVGIAATFARLPVVVTEGGCGQCDSDVSVWQGMATLRLGGGGVIGFHTVFEVAAGAMGFTNFADAGAGPPTVPLRTIVPAVAASYGAGYTLRPGLELSLVQEIGILFHSPAADASSSSSTPRFNATRLLLRYGLPGR